MASLAAGHRAVARIGMVLDALAAGHRPRALMPPRARPLPAWRRSPCRCADPCRVFDRCGPGAGHRAGALIGMVLDAPAALAPVTVPVR
jgi:hypothetical protein